jgi:hypothetical protein
MFCTLKSAYFSIPKTIRAAIRFVSMSARQMTGAMVRSGEGRNARTADPNTGLVLPWRFSTQSCPDLLLKVGHVKSFKRVRAAFVIKPRRRTPSGHVSSTAAGRSIWGRGRAGNDYKSSASQGASAVSRVVVGLAYLTEYPGISIVYSGRKP